MSRLCRTEWMRGCGRNRHWWTAQGIWAAEPRVYISSWWESVILRDQSFHMHITLKLKAVELGTSNCAGKDVDAHQRKVCASGPI